MARKWREVRADAIASGRVDPERVEARRNEIETTVRAHRLAEVRKALGMLRQSDIAGRMGVSQARVSKLERGDLDRTELGTLRSYVEALGGELHVEVKLGGDSIDLTPA